MDDAKAGSCSGQEESISLDFGSEDSTNEPLKQRATTKINPSTTLGRRDRRQNLNVASLSAKSLAAIPNNGTIVLSPLKNVNSNSNNDNDNKNENDSTVTLSINAIDAKNSPSTMSVETADMGMSIGSACARSENCSEISVSNVNNNDSRPRSLTIAEQKLNKNKEIVLFIQYFVIFCIVLAYFIYQWVEYTDTDTNRLDYTLTEQVDEMPLPYIYIDFESQHSKYIDCKIDIEFNDFTFDSSNKFNSNSKVLNLNDSNYWYKFNDTNSSFIVYYNTNTKIKYIVGFTEFLSLNDTYSIDLNYEINDITNIGIDNDDSDDNDDNDDYWIIIDHVEYINISSYNVAYQRYLIIPPMSNDYTITVDKDYGTNSVSGNNDNNNNDNNNDANNTRQKVQDFIDNSHSNSGTSSSSNNNNNNNNNSSSNSNSWNDDEIIINVECASVEIDFIQKLVDTIYDIVDKYDMHHNNYSIDYVFSLYGLYYDDTKFFYYEYYSLMNSFYGLLWAECIVTYDYFLYIKYYNISNYDHTTVNGYKLNENFESFVLEYKTQICDLAYQNETYSYEIANWELDEFWYYINHKEKLFQYSTIETLFDSLFEKSTNVPSNHQISVSYDWFSYDNQVDDVSSPNSIYKKYDYFVINTQGTYILSDNENDDQFILTVEPSAAGIKTTFVTAQKMSWVSIFSATGGMFSSVHAISAFIFIYIIWGFKFGCIKFDGLAGEADPPGREKRRLEGYIKRYIQRHNKDHVSRQELNQTVTKLQTTIFNLEKKLSQLMENSRNIPQLQLGDNETDIDHDD